ncbi:hypothetical protein F5Y14DRAFT_451617 [Nemania sp. NC0429]|nr:hypothetical protein F5Y14DRAFT_451617 [Nemania sp. NC0429]
MHFGRLSPLLVAASAVLGSVMPRAAGDYIWDVTQWQAGLSHGNPADPTTSWYAFSVSGARYESPEPGSYIPAFGARCTGSGAGFPLSSDYTECALDSAISEAGSAVAARIVPDADGTQAHIAISFVFSTSAGDTRNLTAVAVTDWARLRPPYNFTLSPNEAV